MCGRFAVATDPTALAEQIRAIREPSATGAEPAGPNFNVAPTTAVASVVSRHTEPGDRPTRRLRFMRWGLVPPWVKPDPGGAPQRKGPPLINARSENVATSPAFRGSAQGKRCLIPMSGWYEWRPGEGGLGQKSPKTPFFMTPGGDELLCVAGLWSVWKPDKAADPLLSCTIITTDAVGELADIHDRMPLILDERDWDRWLDPDAPLDPELLTTCTDVSGLQVRGVSTLVNNVANNGPELVKRAEPRGRQVTLL